MIPWDRWGKNTVRVFKSAFKSLKPVSFRGAQLLPNARRVARGRRKSRAKSCQTFCHSPRGGHTLLPPLHLRWHRRVTTKAGLSRLRPLCPSPSSHSCEFPQRRLRPRPAPGAASPELPTLTPSPRPELEPQGACAAVARGTERAGMAGAGWRQNSPITTQRGTQFLHSLSAILEGRHRATLRLSLLPPRRRHLRLRASRGNAGGSRTVKVRRGPGRNSLAHGDPPRWHAWGPRKQQASWARGLRAHSQRPFCLPPSEHSARPTVSISHSARAEPRTSSQEPSFALHAGACSCSSSPVILPFLRAPRVGAAALCSPALDHGEFLSWSWSPLLSWRTRKLLGPPWVLSALANSSPVSRIPLPGDRSLRRTKAEQSSSAHWARARLEEGGLYTGKGSPASGPEKF